MRLDVEPPPQAWTLHIDGAPVERAERDGEVSWFAGAAGNEVPVLSGPVTVVVNPGEQVVRWSTGSVQSEQRARGAAGERLQLRFALPEPPKAEPLPRPLPPAPAVPARAIPPLEQPRPLRTARTVAFAGAGGFAAVALGAGLVAAMTQRSLDSSCDSRGVCPSSERERIERFETSTRVANLATAGAITLAGVGVTLWLVDSRLAKILRFESQFGGREAERRRQPRRKPRGTKRHGRRQLRIPAAPER